MQDKIVLISDDSNFFDFMVYKLELRKSDELFRYGFDTILDKLHLLKSSLLIINSEGRNQEVLDLLDILKETPVLLFAYNISEDFRAKAFSKGVLGCFTPETSNKEFKGLLLSGLRLASYLEKNEIYREILVSNNMITKNNEVFLDFTKLLDSEIDKIHNSSVVATLMAIAPDDGTKFKILPNKIETVILNNVRKNDLLMNFAPNKYFLLLKNSDIDKSKRLWEKLSRYLPDGIFSGAALIGRKSRQQVVNEALNNLHNNISGAAASINKNNLNVNFKLKRAEFNRSLEKVITPVMYHICQKYSSKLFGMTVEHFIDSGGGSLIIKSKYVDGILTVSSPGHSVINVDIKYNNKCSNSGENVPVLLQPKRITIEPDDLEQGFLQDLLEQFITEFKEANKYD